MTTTETLTSTARELDRLRREVAALTAFLDAQERDHATHVRIDVVRMHLPRDKGRR